MQQDSLQGWAIGKQGNLIGISAVSVINFCGPDRKNIRVMKTTVKSLFHKISQLKMHFCFHLGTICINSRVWLLRVLFVAAGIIGEEKPRAIKTGQELYHWLRRRDIEIYFLHETAQLLGYPECGLSREELVEAVDFLVSLGGDGTLLHTARIAGASEKPILGVNLGNFGFLVAVEPENIYHSLEKVLSGNYLSDRRMVIKSTVYRNGEVTDVAYGLNDVVITKGGFPQSVGYVLPVSM